MHRTIDVVIGIVVRGGQVLICQRPNDAVLGGYWEFPGGKREPGETNEQCLIRELKEELAIEVTPIDALTPLEHDYPDRRVRLHPYLCTLVSGEPKPLASQRLAWVTPTGLHEYRLPEGNGSLNADLVERLRETADGH